MSYIGTVCSLVAGAPATEDQAGYEALSLVTIARVLSVSEIGDSHEDQSASLLATGRVEHNNGAADGGEINVVLDGEDFTDAGLALLLAANGGNTSHSFGFKGPAQDRYIQGIVRNLKTSSMDTSTKASISFTIAVNTAVTLVAV